MVVSTPVNNLLTRNLELRTDVVIPDNAPADTAADAAIIHECCETSIAPRTADAIKKLPSGVKSG